MTADLEVPYGCGSDAWRDWAENLVACRALGLHCRSIASGEVEMVMDEALYDLNPNGAVHGGLVANAADQVMGVAVAGALPAGQVPVTSTFSMEYHLPARLPLRFGGGRVTRVGRSVVFVEVDFESGDGRVCSRGRVDDPQGGGPRAECRARARRSSGVELLDPRAPGRRAPALLQWAATRCRPTGGQLYCDS